jgi:hypothetical protein
MAADLWCVGVDNGPKELASRVMLSKELLRGDDQITPKTAHTIEHDVRTEPGSWLREVGRVSFQKIEYIRTYYAVAFENYVRKMFDEIGGGYIFALSAYRNALIHNAGKADKKFVKNVERFPELRSIRRDSILMLDGELVRKMRNAAIELGTSLILFVDSVLTPGAVNDADDGS